MKQIKYRKLKNYKYQVYETYIVQTPIYGYKIVTKFITLFKNGKLMIKCGYAWDGASGGARDTKTIMRGSLGHDGLCQLARMGLLPQKELDKVHKLLHTHCLEDKMWKVRARWVWEAVKAFAGFATKVQPSPKIYTAP